MPFRWNVRYVRAIDSTTRDGWTTCACTMKLHRPLHVCAYLFGVFPAARTPGPPPRRFRIHWPGVALKAFHTALYWLVSVVVSIVSIRNLDNYQKMAKKLLATRVLDIEELFVYMMFAGIAATAVCQAHMLWPSVVRVTNECFFDLCQLNHITGVWQHFTAYAVVLFVAYEFAMYFVLITYKSVSSDYCRRPTRVSRTQGLPGKREHFKSVGRYIAPFI